jgi:hypothetical protein
MCVPWDIDKCVIYDEVLKKVLTKYDENNDPSGLMLYDMFENEIKLRCDSHYECLLHPNKKFKYWDQPYCIWGLGDTKFCNKCEKIFDAKESIFCPVNHGCYSTNGSYLG